MSAGVSAAKVGEALGVSADTVRRHWAAWSTDKGFPRPLFDDGLLRWDAEAVRRWKEQRSRPDATQALSEHEPDWAAIARRRGAALDEGRDPDAIAA